MLRVTELRPDTRRVYEFLREDPDIGKFRLIGGTAIALHHSHRESEDLDFISIETRPDDPYPKLDRRAVVNIVDRLRANGFDTTLLFDQVDFDLAADHGVDLMYAHQNWLIDKVKLSFFAPATLEKAKLFANAELVSDGEIRILSSQALFEIKSRLLVERATSRDLYDLWFYMDRQGRTMEEVFAFALNENPAYTDELLKKRLLPPRQSVADPGFLPRLGDGPKDFDELRQRIEVLVNAYEIRVAADVALDFLKPK